MKKTKILLSTLLLVVLVSTAFLAVACEKNYTLTLIDAATDQEVGKISAKGNVAVTSINIDGYILDGDTLYYSKEDFESAMAGASDVEGFVLGETLVTKNVTLYANWIKIALDSGTGYTYRIYSGTIPTYWNPLDYKDADAADLISYGSCSFYEFDYKVEDGQIVPGQFVIRPMMASGDPVDVSAEYANTGFTANGWTVNKGWNINSAYSVEVPNEEGNGTTTVNVPADQNRAWRIPLRANLKWDDGTPIKASDFVETMKILLDPTYKNYRADSYYAGDTIIYNAKQYYYQGSLGWFPAKTAFSAYTADLDDKLVFAWGSASEVSKLPAINETTENVIYFRTASQIPASITAETLVKAYLGDFNGTDGTLTVEDYLALDGKTFAEIKADSKLKAAWDKVIGYWQTDPNEELDFFMTKYTWPEVSFDNVGVIADDDNNTLTIIFEKEFNADHNLFNWAYSMGSFPLVKKDVYMANLKEPAAGSTLYTSTYCTSPATAPSYGPYKLTSLQLGKQYVFEKNPNWVGYTLDYNEGKYQTTRIVCDMIDNWDTAWMLFQKGQLAAVGIDPKIADQYKTSTQAYFTPDDYVNSLQIQSQATPRVVNPNDGNANELLLNQKFRKAISLSLDRADYNATATTSSQAGFGLFGPIHYHDVQNGAVYRDTDVAKRVICEVYGVDVDDYPSLDAAYEAVTGYNLELARQLVKEAIQEEIAKGTIKSTDTKLELTVGSSVDNEAARRPYNYLNKQLNAILVGTPLEGNLKLEYDGTHNSSNSAFADDFLAGQYEFVFAGWSGAAWNPFWFLTAYLSEANRYALGWKPEEVEVEITVKDFDFGSGSHTAKLNLMQWYNCINGNSGAPFNMGEGKATMEDRLTIAAAIEKEILLSYYTVPVSYTFGASLRSYKIKAVSNDYHTFMGWGGVQYYTYNYNDSEWAEYVSSQGGTLDYRR